MNFTPLIVNGLHSDKQIASRTASFTSVALQRMHAWWYMDEATKFCGNMFESRPHPGMITRTNWVPHTGGIICKVDKSRGVRIGLQERAF